ncbi:MAG: TIR domain-containing protein [Phenylobacterium sp.]|uniref:toll/interleukin-1 receptor domain-containing protein n=1 Tax=Phenylobacterium sp. TaxID=1871053 RepID=UPI0025E99E86|nr:toll/interleukin-1 receptor domain-containing protein [Phenylobacterium sp.]MBI1200462.1 TIR domain-containing protein [Phenylobacterium sp.]
MPNVFISHSSKDKPFVRRLAAGLLSEGMPVWLDSWEMEYGASLTDSIYDGIEGSSFVILVISSDAVDSGWVNRELNAALAKEDQTNRRFVIPIKIDGVPAPLKIADRLYADFSGGAFSEPLSRLVQVLDRQGCRALAPLPEREFLSLSFSQEVHLDKTALDRALFFIRERHPNFVPDAKQIVVVDDQDYESLKSKLFNNIDRLPSLPSYTPALEEQLKYARDRIARMETMLRHGVSELLKNKCDNEAIYWFCKIIRARSVYLLWSHQLSEDSDNISYGKIWQSSELNSGSSAKEFFGDDVESVDIWVTGGDQSDYFHLWIGRRECADLCPDGGVYFGPQPYSAVCSSSASGKYIYPQMMLAHLTNPRAGRSPIWNLGRATIGIS